MLLNLMHSPMLMQSTLLMLLVAVYCINSSDASPQMELESGRRLYSGYQVLRTYPTSAEQRGALLLISEEVDFWTEVGVESDVVDIMVAPDKQEMIAQYLFVHAIYYEVLYDDLQAQIDQENGGQEEQKGQRGDEGQEEQDNKYKEFQQELESLLSILPENPRSKRQNGGTGIFRLPIFDLLSELSPPTNRNRRRPEEQGLRKPRRFPSSSSSVPSINSPVSTFPDFKPDFESADCSSSGMNWNHFHSYEVLDRWMECLAAKFGSKVELIKIGQSSEGRVLKVAHVKLGGNSTQSVFVDGGMHAREWASPASVSFILHKLVETSELDHLLNKYDIFILPLANPDGYMYSRDHDRMWRKTRSRTGQSSLFGQECFGVDPNRNFGYRWGGHGASDNACKETYRGPHAFSEPETLAIKNFVTSGRNFQLYLTFHSYGQYILYPWGYDAINAPDWKDLHRVGSRTAEVLANKYGSIYEVGSAAKLLYPASGGSDDFAKGGAGIKYSFTVELPDTGKHAFILPARLIKNVGNEAVTCLDTMLSNI